MSYYEIDLNTPTGTRLAQFTGDNIVSLNMARAGNNVGSLTLVIPATIQFNYLQPDCQLEIYRTSDGGITELLTDTRWLVNKYSKQIQNGQLTYTLTCADGNDLLTRAYVLYPANDTTYTSLNTYADDEMKTVVAQNLGSSVADSTRKTYNPPLSIQANSSAAQVVPKDFAKQQLLTLFQSLADASATAGTLLYFDVPWSTSAGSFEFRTYINQRGSDLSSGNNQVIFDPYRQNLFNPMVEYDYTTENNYAYVAGQGAEDTRKVVVVYNTARMLVSPYGKREIFVDARQVVAGSANETASLTAEGNAALRDNRAHKTFTGQLQSLPQCEFGTHWHFGDRVTANWDTDTFTCYISALTITLQGGKETISGTLRSIT